MAQPRNPLEVAGSASDILVEHPVENEYSQSEIETGMFEPPTIRRSETRRRLAQSNLKRCPLCSALNARNNGSCFVCGWFGAFDHDPFRIEESLVRLIYQSPELKLEEPKQRPGKLVSWLLTWRRRIDLRA